jgi:uncharacterized membrane protein YkgB
MKKITLTLIIALCVNAINAQITITDADMPLPGDNVLRTTSSATGTGFDFTLTGPNYNWDFTSLVGTGADTTIYKNIANAPGFTGIVFGLFAPAYTRSNMFRNEANPLNFPALVSNFFKVDSAFSFIKKNTSVFAKTGFSLKLNSFDLPLPYDSNDNIYRFPLNYGNADSCISQFVINNPLLSFLYYKQRQKRVNHVDGWGKILLPYNGTFDVLRVKSELTGSDSLHVDTLFINQGFTLPRAKQVEYKWLAKGLKTPVLQVIGAELAGVFTPSTITYLFTPFPEAINNNNGVKNIFAMADAATQNIAVVNNSGLVITKIIITNLNGQIVSNSTINNADAVNYFSSVQLAPNIYNVKTILANNSVVNNNIIINK